MTSAGDAGPPRPLGAWLRLVGALAGHGLILAATPGLVTPDGSAWFALLGVAVWGATVRRPFPRRDDGRARRWPGLLAEWFGGAIGGGGAMAWIWYVTPGGVFFIGAGWGVYCVVAGWALRSLARRLPLPWAVALAWSGVETLRSVPVPPFGLGWMRLGFHAHHVEWLAGAARVVGPEGLGFVLALAAGSLAALEVGRPARWRALVPGAGALAVGALLAAVTAPPATKDGPAVLLVQPAFSQERKQFADPRENFAASRALTRRALEARAAAGEPPVDLVCWGESMLYVPLVEPAAADEMRAGTIESPPWNEPIDSALLERFDALEDGWVRDGLFGLGPGSRGVLTSGTSLLAGAEVFVPRDGLLRRVNAAVLYDAEGHRSPPAPKRYLVPGAETMGGLERFGLVRSFAASLAGYVPDFVPAEEPVVLELFTRDGERYRLGASVCFDNAFLPPFTLPFSEADGVDFHVVVSNEAWYRNAFEMDQMVAFSRVAALATGRAVVRATNSGISLVLGPDGAELGRVRGLDEAGRESDRGVPGTLAALVPVPAAREGTATTPYVRLRSPLRILLVVLPLGLAARLARRPGNGRNLGRMEG